MGKIKTNRFVSRKDISLWIFVAAVTLLYGFTFLLAEFHDNPFNSVHDTLVLSFHWIVVEFAVFGLIYFISISRRIFAFIFPLITVLCSIIAYYRCTVHLTLTAEIVELVFTNDMRTSTDMISVWLLMVIILAAVMSFFIVRKRWQIGRLQNLWLHLPLSVMVILAPFAVDSTYGAIMNRMPYSLLFSVSECIKNHNAAADVRPDFKDGAECGTDSITVVLVIGESLRADNMQINGYGRPTTPLLCKERNVVSLPNVYSDYNYTSHSVAHFMTRSDEKHSDRAFKERSFVSLMRKAGYSSVWFANQEAIRTFVYFMKECDRLEYVCGGKNEYVYEKWIDMDILPYFERELNKQGEKKLLILHTIGSHWYYNMHFTAEHEVFKPVTDSKIVSSNTAQQMRNSYDNTIVCSDAFWHELINRLRHRNAILIYLSDHGESLGENGVFIHGSADMEEQHRPGCFVWYSDEFGKRYPQKIKALDENKNKRWKSYFLFHSILDAADIKSVYIDKGMDIFHRQ